MRYMIHIEDHDDANGGWIDVPDDVPLEDLLKAGAEFLKGEDWVDRERFSVCFTKTPGGGSFYSK